MSISQGLTSLCAPGISSADIICMEHRVERARELLNRLVPDSSGLFLNPYMESPPKQASLSAVISLPDMFNVYSYHTKTFLFPQCTGTQAVLFTICLQH